MKKISEIVTSELINLAYSDSLQQVIDTVGWKAGMRMRVILELDIEEDGVRLHGFEFRYRQPDLKMIRGSGWK